jgi:hypothetical protein
VQVQTPVPPASNFNANGYPDVRGGSGSYDVPVTSGSSRQAQLALLVGLLALATTGASIYGLGTDFDVYVTYAAGAIGFVSVLAGFTGVGRSLRSEGGRGRSFFAIFAGFLAIGLNTYEYLYPRELYDIIADLF